MISIVFHTIAKLNIKMNIKMINGNIKWFNKNINMIKWEKFKDIYYLNLFTHKNIIFNSVAKFTACPVARYSVLT
jgi:hypothetical protein